MDVKAMAKSKRSHSQLHSKKLYPKLTEKATVDAAKAPGNSNRTSGIKVVEKPLRSRGAELPSNSDRYLDEDDLGTDDLLHGVAGSSYGAENIKPKSKGADYRYLITEARSQPHSYDCMDVYSSLDEILPDLNQGFENMVSVGGEAILSWTAADYFIVEDKASTSYAASFLSLNLKTLSEQLAKVDLAQRLFIEPDLLPPELLPHKSKLIDDGKEEQFQNSADNKASKADHQVANFPQPLVEDEIVLKEVAVTSTNVSDHDDRDDAALSALKVKSLVKDNIFPDLNKMPPTFQASQAEAELDMLLDSLGETEVQVSSQIPSMQPQPLIEIHTSKTSSGLDDAIDDLLGSTSYMEKNATGLDDAIDGLMGSTSYLTIQDNTLKSQKGVTERVETAKTSSSSSKAKMVDDFDAWLETL